MRSNAKDWILWKLWSWVVFRQRHGPFWFWGRKGREERFIQRLLLAYPGLEHRSRSELRNVPTLVRDSLRVRRIFFVSSIAAFVAAMLISFLIVELRVYDFRIPKVVRIALVLLSAGVTSDLVRRSYISQSIDRAVAKAYPMLFCECGYCLLGLPTDAKCPECGKPRPLES